MSQFRIPNFLSPTNRPDSGKSLEVDRLPPLGLQGETPAVELAHRVENGVHTHGFQLAHLRHQLAEAPFGKSAFAEPLEVFLRQVHDGDAAGRIGLDAELAEWNPRLADLDQEIAEILAIDLGNFSHGRVSSARSRAAWAREP